MKIFMIGGAGLLGSEAARELIARGHEVSSIALRPRPENAGLPPEMEIEYGNHLEMSDDQLREKLAGCEGFVFAAGVDERVEGPAPVYDLYRKYNIDPVRRLLSLCRECGVKHAVILGSYFSYAAKKWPEKTLSKYHPYIKSRIDQECVAMSFAGDDMDVAVLELPYIFGAQPGRRPVWLFLTEYICSMKAATFYPKGGTAMITVRQAGQAVAGAIERSRGGRCWPVGWYNLTWKQMLCIFHKYLGCPDKRIITIPKWMFALGAAKILRDHEKRGVQPGLHPVRLADLMCDRLYISDTEGARELGVTEDDLDAAIGGSVLLCRAIMEGRAGAVGMKGE